MFSKYLIFLTVFSWALAVQASSADGKPLAYAVVIGSNPGGEGQEPLKYAESDARRVKDVLVQLGQYSSDRVRLLLSPGPDEVRDVLEGLGDKLAEHDARGEDTTLFFYYSGHARARAMNLGTRSLEVGELRRRLSKLPTALTIVVLDACQSGAFARVKGAEPAADFSFNSVASLNTRGLAVMASSSSAELSQESDRLESSFFTHHLLVGLRGAGDRNQDGRVSLDEAYRYAYGATLAATARTAVGKQHVVLETDLTGQGDVPMTFPDQSRSRLVLAEDFEGEVLLQNLPHRAVLAEVTKTKGQQPLRLAVPPAQYEAVVRQGDETYACRLELGENQSAGLDLSTCSPVVDEPVTTKGESEPHEAWGFEVAAGFGFAQRNDDYVQQLRSFGYEPYQDIIVPDVPLRWSLGVSRWVIGPLSLVARVRLLDERDFDRGFFTDDNKRFEWAAYGLGIGPRLNWNLVANRLDLYGQLEIGPAYGVTRYFDGNSTPHVEETERFAGFLGAVSGGVQFMAGKYMGLYLEGSYTYAPVIDNLVGDTHDSGGAAAFLGIRARTWK